MTAQEISKYALGKLKLYGVKLNAAEEEEALNWLTTRIEIYAQEQSSIAVLNACVKIADNGVTTDLTKKT